MDMLGKAALFPSPPWTGKKCLCSHKHPPHAAARSILQPGPVELLKHCLACRGTWGGGAGAVVPCGCFGRQAKQQVFFLAQGMMPREERRKV